MTNNPEEAPEEAAPAGPEDDGTGGEEEAAGGAEVKEPEVPAQEQNASSKTAPPPSAEEPAPAAEAASPAEGSAPAGLNRRILVVEDSFPLRRMIEKLLTVDGFEVDAVENGKRAVQKLKKAKTPYGLMVLDLMMPEMDGVQTMAYIKKNEIPAPPVVICSSRSDKETIRLVHKLGARGYILKPFKTQLVLQKVRVAIGLELPPED